MAKNSHADAFYDLLEAAGCDPLTTQWERAFLAAIRAQVEEGGQPWLSDEQSRVLARIALKIGIELPPRVRDLVDTPEQARLLAFVMDARGDPRLTAWEEGFLVSISDAVRVCRPLSDKQRAVLARIATKAVPEDLRAILGRREFKRALRGGTTAEIGAQHRALMDEWEAEITTARAKLRGDLQHLSNRDVWTISGEWYRERVALNEDDPGSAAGWQITTGELIDQVAFDPNEEPAPAFEPNRKEIAEADAILRARSVAATPESVRRFAVAIWETKIRFGQLMERRARGDYGADPNASRFPSPPEPPSPTAAASMAEPTPAQPSAPPLTFAALITARQGERQLAESTVSRYGSATRAITTALGFSDVRQITVDHVREYKAKRLTAGINPGTVQDDVITAGVLMRVGGHQRSASQQPVRRHGSPPQRKAEGAGRVQR